MHSPELRNLSGPLIVVCASFALACVPSAPIAKVKAVTLAEGGPKKSSPGHVTSNILRQDYAGSAVCQQCHLDIYREWESSPMRHMTRNVGEAHIKAPFDGTTFRLNGDSASVRQKGAQKFVQLRTNRGGVQLYRVTRVIGGRYREDFVGVEVSSAPDPSSDPAHGPEKVLPLSYVFSTQSFRYKGYSVMLPERPGLVAGPVWAESCIGCHNTLPQVSLLYDDLLGPGAPSYQGHVGDNLLPASRQSRIVTTEPEEEHSGLHRAIEDELETLGEKTKTLEELPWPALLKQAIEVTRKRLQARQLIEMGVGCEACHGGASAHAEDPRLLPSFGEESPFLQRLTADGQPANRAQRINQTCARCHTVLFSRYPWTWEGGRRSDEHPGGSSTNSGEARDFQLGACATQMSCASCHDAHAADPPELLSDLSGEKGNKICIGCHTGLNSSEAVRAHSHHESTGPGSSCIGCHMPKKNMGLDYNLTPYHRIASPDEVSKVLKDRPLECALCHQDKSVESLVATMETWWGKHYDREKLHVLYGKDLGINALEATIVRGKPHEQAVAISLFGEARDTRRLPLLWPQLSHEYPLVRFFAQRAIQNITGLPLNIDPNQSASEISRQVNDLEKGNRLAP